MDFPDGPMVKNRPISEGAWIQSLIQEDALCLRTDKPVSYNFWAPTTETDGP